jgi:penicillin-binding protein 2
MNQFSDRKFIIGMIILLVGMLYLGRLFYIQVINDSYKLDAKNQAFRYETDFPVRGYIYDRNGKLLVFNEAAYDLMVIPRQAKDIDSVALCNLLGITTETYATRMQKAKEYSSRKPTVFEKQISAQTYAALQEKMYKYPGFFVQPRTLRKYPKSIAAHLLGYIGEVDKRVTEKNPYYRDGDYIGISGIEKSYEKELRGIKGTRIMMVDVHNRPKGSYMNGAYDTAAVPGQHLTSTLDAELQWYGEQLMKNKLGSVVAIEPGTGEILALITSPTYDPNLLVGRTRSHNYAQLAKDTVGLPLFNRALKATYPPGSTFKLVMALVGQQEGVLTPQTRYPCARGYPPLGGKPKCHPHASPLDLEGSIQNSCNSYYSYVFKSVMDNKKYPDDRIGFEKWREYALSFGIGKLLGSDLPYENKGSLPTSKYYDKVFGKNGWRASTIISLGIGQAELGITPIQNANIVATIANKGYYHTPHIIKYVGDSKKTDDKWLKKNYTMVTDTSFYNTVIEGMSMVVKAGTARVAQIPGIEVCGKTGTAQNPHGKDHSVFVCFAPRENPKIAIAILVENSGFGATYAAPIASLMMEKYLTGKITRPDMEKRMLEANLIKDKYSKKDAREDSH